MRQILAAWNPERVNNMAMYKGRYGLSSGEVRTLYETCWRGKGLNKGYGWVDFDAFARWAAATRYVKHARLRRIRTGKPYGPENAFWDFPDTVKREYPEGHPCKGCDLEPGCSVPCDIRLQYWDAGMAQLRGLMEVHGND